MAERVPKKMKVEIPFLLREAVRNGRAILFLGAGASKECRNKSGETPPDADQLRDIISQKYFGKLMPRRTVMAVAEMAIENGAGSRVRTHYSHQMTAAARAIAAMKFLMLRSKRVAIRRQSLRRQNMRSMMLRCL